jgi:ubiquinone/menaquinone biosynthesis C-methylase UbiE
LPSTQEEIQVVDNLTDWETRDGVAFLKNIGVKTGDKILDFGCGVGHYSIPAAIAVGETGTVHAVDRDQDPLDEIKRKADRLGLKNIKMGKYFTEIGYALVGCAVNVILLYDVLHYFERSDRIRLYGKCFRILDDDGLLSVYPKHTIEDVPVGKFENIGVPDIISEVNESGYRFIRKYCAALSHNDSINQGCVLNFTKKIKV